MYLLKYYVDIVECLNGNGGCAQHCINDIGSYHCGCTPGYTLSSNGRDCLGTVIPLIQYKCIAFLIFIILFIDNDECSANTDNCDHGCTNTPGSFLCKCNTGYRLQSDGRTCRGMS